MTQTNRLKDFTEQGFRFGHLNFGNSKLFRISQIRYSGLIVKIPQSKI